jgi:hypothetical protein
LDEDVIEIIACINRKELHAGANTLFLHEAHHFYTIARDEVYRLLPFYLCRQDERTATSALTPFSQSNHHLYFNMFKLMLLTALSHLTITTLGFFMPKITLAKLLP